MTNLSCDVAEPSLALNKTEHAIATLWTEILQTTDLAKPTDSFFELGGSSIDMVMLLFRIHEEFSVELADGSVFQAPTLRELARLVEQARDEAHSK